MKEIITIKTLNGSTLKKTIEIHFGGLTFNSTDEFPLAPLSLNVYSNSKESILKSLIELFPKADIKKISFSIISKDLEVMQKFSIKPDFAELSKVVTDMVLNHIARELGAYPYHENQQTLRGKEKEFQTIFLKISDMTVNHPGLSRAYVLFEEKKYFEALQLLSSVWEDIDVNYEKCEAELLFFILRLKNERENSDAMKALFVKGVQNSAEFPHVVKRYYFEYIRFLENIRSYREPRKLIADFEKKYPTTILNYDEISLYNYLKGRAEYLRGDYLAALSHLQLALNHHDPNDKKFLSAIYNTSVNSFTDNLFFEEARWLANEALNLRNLLLIPEINETLSCLAGIEFKSCNFSGALERYLEAEKRSENHLLTNIEKNRLYNYIAKSAIMCKDFNLAESFLQKAEAAGDQRGFSKTIALILLFEQKEYDKMFELFKQTIMLPENQEHDGYDMFALGWGYTMIARSAFEKKLYKDGVIYLSNAINFFIQDRYILEAQYISLYAYYYSIPKKYMSYFEKMITEKQLGQLFEEYVEKHESIRDEYFYSYNYEAQASDETPRLRDFYNQVVHINSMNYNPSELEDIFDSICLF
jgi:tetratricopeptide (TPR) repeat protein